MGSGATKPAPSAPLEEEGEPSPARNRKADFGTERQADTIHVEDELVDANDDLDDEFASDTDQLAAEDAEAPGVAVEREPSVQSFFLQSGATSAPVQSETNATEELPLNSRQGKEQEGHHVNDMHVESMHGTVSDIDDDDDGYDAEVEGDGKDADEDNIDAEQCGVEEEKKEEAYAKSSPWKAKRSLPVATSRLRDDDHDPNDVTPASSTTPAPESSENGPETEQEEEDEFFEQSVSLQSVSELSDPMGDIDETQRQGLQPREDDKEENEEVEDPEAQGDASDSGIGKRKLPLGKRASIFRKELPPDPNAKRVDESGVGFSSTFLPDEVWDVLSTYCKANRITQEQLEAIFHKYESDMGSSTHLDGDHKLLGTISMKGMLWNFRQTKLTTEIADVFIPRMFLLDMGDAVEAPMNPTAVSFVRFVIGRNDIAAMHPFDLIYEFVAGIVGHRKLKLDFPVFRFNLTQVVKFMLSEIPERTILVDYLMHKIPKGDMNTLTAGQVVVMGAEYPLLFYALISFQRQFRRKEYGDKFWKNRCCRKCLHAAQCGIELPPHYERRFQNVHTATMWTARSLLADAMNMERDAIRQRQCEAREREIKRAQEAAALAAEEAKKAMRDQAGYDSDDSQWDAKQDEVHALQEEAEAAAKEAEETLARLQAEIASISGSEGKEHDSASDLGSQAGSRASAGTGAAETRSTGTGPGGKEEEEDDNKTEDGPPVLAGRGGGAAAALLSLGHGTAEEEEERIHSVVGNCPLRIQHCPELRRRYTGEAYESLTDEQCNLLKNSIGYKFSIELVELARVQVGETQERVVRQFEVDPNEPDQKWIIRDRALKRTFEHNLTTGQHVWWNEYRHIGTKRIVIPQKYRDIFESHIDRDRTESIADSTASHDTSMTDKSGSIKTVMANFVRDSLYEVYYSFQDMVRGPNATASSRSSASGNSVKSGSIEGATDPDAVSELSFPQT